MPDPLASLRTLLGPRLLEEAAVLEENASDFGRLHRMRPLAVARPADTAEVAAVVKWARGAKVPLVTRGKAHSQSGLSLLAGAVVL
ncbi:MAG: FAD-binding protein, partial [Planctomycetaceae bacterium]|nr:FAD-binding protein [Planctomycetaceae bacterium]